MKQKLTTHPESSIEFPFGKLHGIFRLPWFRRIWVVQEVALAKKVVFYCGEQTIYFDLLASGADFTRLPYSKLTLEASHWRSYIEHHHTLQEFVRRKQEGEDITGILSLKSVLLVPGMTLEATKPDDNVYGMYGICKSLSLKIPPPDYRKPLSVVFTETARLMIDETGDLELLSFVEGSASIRCDLPSWVPDFSGTMAKWSPVNPPHMVVGTRTHELLSGSKRCEYVFEPDGRRLKIKGRRFDCTISVGMPWQMPEMGLFKKHAQSKTGKIIESLLDCIQSWCLVIEGLPDHSSRQATLEILAHILFNNDDLKALRHEDYSNIIQFLSTIVNLSFQTSSDPQQSVCLIDPNDRSLPTIKMGNYILSSSFHQTITQLSIHSAWKALIRTEQNRLGTATHSAMVDDALVLFSGCKFPCLVRLDGDGAYRYVGPAFIHRLEQNNERNTLLAGDEEWFVLK